MLVAGEVPLLLLLLLLLVVAAVVPVVLLLLVAVGVEASDRTTVIGFLVVRLPGRSRRRRCSRRAVCSIPTVISTSPIRRSGGSHEFPCKVQVG